MKPVRIAGAFIALVVLAGSVVLTLARLLDSEAEGWVLAASFVPWALVGYVVALVLFALVRWGLAVVPRADHVGGPDVGLRGRDRTARVVAGAVVRRGPRARASRT